MPNLEALLSAIRQHCHVEINDIYVRLTWNDEGEHGMQSGDFEQAPLEVILLRLLYAIRSSHARDVRYCWIDEWLPNPDPGVEFPSVKISELLGQHPPLSDQIETMEDE